MKGCRRGVRFGRIRSCVGDWGCTRRGILDFGDPTPMFDLRSAAICRGRGYGTEIVRWLTSRISSCWADKDRLGHLALRLVDRDDHPGQMGRLAGRSAGFGERAVPGGWVTVPAGAPAGCRRSAEGTYRYSPTPGGRRKVPSHPQVTALPSSTWQARRIRIDRGRGTVSVGSGWSRTLPSLSARLTGSGVGDVRRAARSPRVL